MHLLVTGDYDPSYNRTQILLNGLKENSSITLTEFPITNFKDLKNDKFKSLAEKADFIYLPPFTHESVKKIKKITSTPIIFDPLISKYLTKVFDYKQIYKYSPRAYKNYLKDKIALNLADVIIADTNAHKNYFNKKFKLNKNKIQVLPIGADIRQFNPHPKEKSTIFNIGFYGGFIPLQGVSNIIETAQQLKNHDDIRFNLIGTGFEWEKMKKLVTQKGLTNVTFLGWIEQEKLPEEINKFDLCLGIFGNTLKADLVIPNKIYHYAALQKCILSKSSPAILEIFKHQENIILTDPSPKKISEQILLLKNNPEKMNKIASNAYHLIKTEFNQNKIADRFLSILENYTT